MAGGTAESWDARAEYRLRQIIAASMRRPATRCTPVRRAVIPRTRFHQYVFPKLLARPTRTSLCVKALG
jgi:hypothetical protein